MKWRWRGLGAEHGFPYATAEARGLMLDIERGFSRTDAYLYEEATRSWVTLAFARVPDEVTAFGSRTVRSWIEHWASDALRGIA